MRPETSTLREPSPLPAALPPEREYHPLFSWEAKRGDLSTTQRRVARSVRWGRYKDRACPFCSIALDVRDLQSKNPLQIHHTIPRGMPGCNLIFYLRLCHSGCNANAGKPQHPPTIPNVSERCGRTGLKEWASAEGERASVMRPLWNLVIYAPDTGLLHEEGMRAHRKTISSNAPGAVGAKIGRATFGSSVTFDRYVTEDIGAGFLKDIGDKMVERTNKAFPFTETEEANG